MPPCTAPATDNGSSDEEDPCLPVIVKLTKCTVAESKTSTSKPTTKESKKVVTKTFKFEFVSSEENYHEFLEKILEVFDIPGLSVSKKSVFRLKLQVPPAKVDGAVDIENMKEYLNTVSSKITGKTFMKDIVASADMKDIKGSLKKKKSSQARASAGGDDEDSVSDGEAAPSGSDDVHFDDFDANGLTPVDKELACLRGLLEKEHGNSENNKPSYTDPISGDEIVLSQGMILEWARAIYDGKATVKMPPTTPNFDAMNKGRLVMQRSGVPTRSSSTTPSTASSEDTAVVHALNILNNTIGLLGHAFGGSALPSTPIQRRPVVLTLSPLTNTPSKLEHFLKYCEEKHGLTVAASGHWQTTLEGEGYGPDIMQHVPHTTLTQLLSISAGDAIRLTKAAEEWWDLESKKPRKRTADDAGLEKRFLGIDGKLDGGSYQVYGSGLEMGDIWPDLDYIWYYRPDDNREFIPIPRGMLPMFNEDPDFDFGGSPDRPRMY
ncbi:hypothetical protein FA13DRAFT_1796285 [Coprinellus micaceus]|uniref:Uncharacterized protein n=1 Tax=Coprinellus micaceus TaxID=71717 RepID=A0A4Y7SUM4_COPMI|nr:hypothetical protein FA13DRAFT_1796285 [Coprinellus micaceus]